MNTSTKDQSLRLLMEIICGEYEERSPLSPDQYAALIEIAIKNKIFLEFYRKSVSLNLALPVRAHLLGKQFNLRRETQKEALKELSLLSENLGIYFMVVKTLKPFNYVGDDIDLLVSNREDLKLLTTALLKQNYFVRQKGTPEITFRKFILGVAVDLDVHDELAAGHVQYLNAQDIWRNKVKTKIDGYELLKPTITYEILITVAHSVLKEFRMTVADLYHYLKVVNKVQRPCLSEFASRNGLNGAFGIFSSVVNHFVDNFDLRICGGGGRVELPTPVRSRILKSNCHMPYAYPVDAIAYAYADKFRWEVRRRGFHAIWDYIRLPSSNGIALVFDYLGWTMFKREPIPWKRNE